MKKEQQKKEQQKKKIKIGKSSGCLNMTLDELIKEWETRGYDFEIILTHKKYRSAKA